MLSPVVLMLIQQKGSIHTTLEHLKYDQGGFYEEGAQNLHPLVEGIILERTTGMHVADYFQKKVWEKVGAEFDASWSLDSQETGFEKMESGLNFISIDYAKIGSMLLHRGKWNGEQVVSEAWLDQSIVAPKLLTPEECDTPFMEGKPAGSCTIGTASSTTTAERISSPQVNTASTSTFHPTITQLSSVRDTIRAK